MKALLQPHDEASTQPVIWRVEDGVGHIVLNWPDAANALDLVAGLADSMRLVTRMCLARTEPARRAR